MDKTMVKASKEREFLTVKIPFYYKGTKFIVIRINSTLLYVQLLKVSRLCTRLILELCHHVSQQLSSFLKVSTSSMPMGQSMPMGLKSKDFSSYPRLFWTFQCSPNGFAAKILSVAPDPQIQTVLSES